MKIKFYLGTRLGSEIGVPGGTGLSSDIGVPGTSQGSEIGVQGGTGYRAQFRNWGTRGYRLPGSVPK